MNAIVMTEEFWANSQFSIARYYGRIHVGNHDWVIVNKDGKNIFELSHKTIDGKNVYAGCLISIYSRWPNDKCLMWEKWQKN